MTIAEEVYDLEEFRLPLPRYLASAALSLVVALATMGGTSTPVVRSGYRIRRCSDGEVVREMSDSMSSEVDTGALIRGDLSTMSVAEFDQQWL